MRSENWRQDSQPLRVPLQHTTTESEFQKLKNNLKDLVIHIWRPESQNLGNSDNILLANFKLDEKNTEFKLEKPKKSLAIAIYDIT